VCEDPLQLVANEVRCGKIVALKGVGGFHLAADATDPAVVQKLRELKGRSTKPFAVMVGDLHWADACAQLDDETRHLLCSAANPIVLAPWIRGGPLVEEVAPGLDMVGLFLPYTPIHHLLFRTRDANQKLPPLIMTSGNAADEPIATGNREAFRRLAHFADLFLLHNRDILSRADDSVVQQRRGQTVFIRRSRGYVPRPIRVPERFPAVLGTGAFLKATPCVLEGNEAFLGQHVGDLSTVESVIFHRSVIQSICDLTGIEPNLVGCDLNPDFPSSRWATEYSGLPVEPVQHHHAHVNAAALSLGMTPPVLGLAIDGTGLGSDDAIWGCELLWAEKRDFVRLGHLNYAPLPGGDAAVDEPWRSAIGLLLVAYGDDADEIISRVLPGVPNAEKHRVLEMARQGVNTPFHSSCGRLFDAVAALAGVCTHATHEAQAPMALESAILGAEKASAHGPTSWRLELAEEDGVAVLDQSLLLRTVTEIVLDDGKAADVAIKFHESLASGLADLVEWGARKVNVSTVVLTGGCMLNRHLSRRLVDELQRRGIEGALPTAISPGDGGTSVGQAAVAAWRQSAG
jgi:hydrogenase maturation protein HypF